MVFEKLESKVDHFGHSPKLILAEFDFFLYSPKLIPPNCIEISEWADSPKFLPAKISSLKVIIFYVNLKPIRKVHNDFWRQKKL